MSWRKPLDTALDGLGDETGPVEVDAKHGKARVDVVERDRIGVRVRDIKLTRKRSVDVAEEAERLSGREVGALPGRMAPSEVAPKLGGAVLRTHPEDMRDREFYEIGLDGPTDVKVRRMRVGDDGDREQVEWDITRDQLGRLLDDLS